MSLPMSLQAVSKHVAVLERAGLVRRRREGRSSVLRLRVQPLRHAAEWLGFSEKLVPGRLERLEDLLAGRPVRALRRS